MWKHKHGTLFSAKQGTHSGEEQGVGLEVGQEGRDRAVVQGEGGGQRENAAQAARGGAPGRQSVHGSRSGGRGGLGRGKGGRVKPPGEGEGLGSGRWSSQTCGRLELARPFTKGEGPDPHGGKVGCAISRSIPRWRVEL
jgi:hypothetical protein